MNPLVSIIIPVYNVEEYIERCIKSIQMQTYENFETIIVDDGSPDKSIPIARTIVQNDNRFIFVQKKNGGLSSARNYGLKHARGRYVVFIDSDDYIAPTYLEEMVKGLSSNVDIVICDINDVDVNGNILFSFKHKYVGVCNSASIIDSIIEAYFIPCVAWNKLYNIELFNNNGIYFPEGILYEDFPTVSKLLLKADSICFINKPLIFYVKRENSITTTYNKKAIDDSLIGIESIKCYLQEEKLYIPHQRSYFIAYLIHYVYRCAQLISSSQDSRTAQMLYKFIKDCNSSIFTISNIFLLLRRNRLMLFGKLMLLKLNPLLFLFIFKTFKK